MFNPSAQKPVNETIEKREFEYYPDISNIASAGECTGLMHTPPQNQEEVESYQDLSGMQIPKKKQ